MLKQHFKERKNIQTVKIPHPKPQVKHPTFPFRRYQQCIDGGNPVLLVEVIEDRGFPFRSPGATDVWNEQEARFIHENQGPKAFGFFLYGAIGKPSNARFLSRFFVKPGVLVSGNSIPFPGGSSTHGWGDTGSQGACEWFGQSASRSKGLSDTLQPVNLTRAALLGLPFRFEKAWEAAPGSSLRSYAPV